MNFNDVFGEEFLKENTKSKKNSTNKYGKDIILSLEISFMESIQGVQKTLSYTRVETCNMCKGSKCAPGSAPTKCQVCDGLGEVLYGNGQMSMDCPQCKGEGKIIENMCKDL